MKASSYHDFFYRKLTTVCLTLCWKKKNKADKIQFWGLSNLNGETLFENVLLV